MQRFREFLALVLLALLPFHAFLVTVFTRVLSGPAHAPLPQLALWKEGLLGMIVLLAFLEAVQVWWRRARHNVLEARVQPDWIDGLIVTLVLLSIPVSQAADVSFPSYALGFRYDFLASVAFLVLRRVQWSDAFLSRAMTLLLGVGGIVAGYGLVTLVLPPEFFTAMGYSDLHSLYLPNRPIAAFQQIGDSFLRRIQGPMSGPNQLGLWLLIPWSILCVRLLSRPTKERAALGVLIALALFLTFSRAAWIAAFVVLLVALWQLLPWRQAARWTGTLTIAGVLAALMLTISVPSVIVRVASSRGHIENPLKAIHAMIEHPAGRGLGSAGPASNRTSDACVLLREGDDPSWAQAHPDLCVFVGDVQVQPIDRACDCPFLPENWYLQMGVELGWAGFVLYVALSVLLLVRLRRAASFELRAASERRSANFAVLLAFIGVSIAALFLHAWEDAAIAYGLWMLSAICLPIVDHD